MDWTLFEKIEVICDCVSGLVMNGLADSDEGFVARQSADLFMLDSNLLEHL